MEEFLLGIVVALGDSSALKLENITNDMPRSLM